MYNHLIKEYCEEAKLTYSERAAASYIQWGLANSYVIDHKVDDKIVGVISFVVVNHHLTGEKIARKMTWFVSKEHRGRIGFDLLKKAEDKAKELGAVRFYCSTPTKMLTDYFPLETEYVKELA